MRRAPTNALSDLISPALHKTVSLREGRCYYYPMSLQSGVDNTAESLHLTLPANDNGSVMPWIIAIGGSALLVILFLQTAGQIPATLEQQAKAKLAVSGIASAYPDVKIKATGRDLHLSGRVLIDQSTEPLHAQLSEIDGVNHVYQRSLTVFDPALQQRVEAQNFKDALGLIDISTVGFQPGSVRFTTQSELALAQILQLLKQYPNSRIRIEGHTDNTGADTVNVRVSRERASAVASYFMGRGVAASRLTVTGFGSTRPIADNSTEAGRSLNRRIEVNPVN